MKLGICYNLFDAEELLEFSIDAIKSEVDFICVVYQKISNWGNPCNVHLEDLLKKLKNRGKIHELIFYTPKEFLEEERKKLVSKNASKEELNFSIMQISNVFFNELMKRELGRQACQLHGCTHFISMDSDEFYLISQLRYAKRKILENNYDATACRMRIFFKLPIYEFYPYDNINAVPFIYKISNENTFQLLAPYPILLDPTRRLDNIQNFYIFERNEIEMYHMSFVRKNMRMKLENVSNKFNYGNFEDFLKKFESWSYGQPIIHPHPNIGKLFTSIKIVDNYFSIDLNHLCRICSDSQNTKLCGRCHKVRYCSISCQKEDWPVHKNSCYIKEKN